MSKKIIYMTQGALIAAIYVVLTLLANSLGLANHAIQVRFSEALTILPFFTNAAIPGLFLGCIISNILTGCMFLDVVFGSMATLIGALGTYFFAWMFRHGKIAQYLAPIPPILANTIIVPYVLANVYHLDGSIPFFMLTVGLGEVISCGVLGMLLMKLLLPIRDKIFHGQDESLKEAVTPESKAQKEVATAESIAQKEAATAESKAQKEAATAESGFPEETLTDDTRL